MAHFVLTERHFRDHTESNYHYTHVNRHFTCYFKVTYKFSQKRNQVKHEF